MVLEADNGVVLEAVKQYWEAIVLASEELKADKEVVLEVVKYCGSGWYVLKCTSDERSIADLELPVLKFASEKTSRRKRR